MAHKATPTSFGFGYTFALVLLAMFWARAMAQSSCTNTIISMSPCLNYIMGNSSSPSQQCCTQLASVVRSSPECLCQVLNGGGSSLGININQTQALALPRACNVQTPPVSRCNAGSPAESPSGTPNFQTPGAPSGTGDGSKSTDTDGTSDGNSVKLSMPLLIVVLLTAYRSALSAF